MTKTSLLRSVAFGAVLAVGVGAHAQAADKADCPANCKPVHHHHHKAAPKPVENPLVGEVAALKAEVAALEQRLDATNAAAQSAQAASAQAQASAQASAQAAQAAAQSDQLAINQIPGAVNTAVAALPKPKPGWEGNTKVGGVLFYNFSDIAQKTNGVKVAPSGTGFDIKRTYLSVDHSFNDVYSADLTLDALYEPSVTSASAPSVPPGAPAQKTTATDTVFIKKAYVQAAYSPMFTVRLGGAELPWVPFVEGLYGYRYVENVLIDRTKFGTSTDWGAHVFGSFLDNHLSYAVSAIDGAGYKTPGQPAQSTITGHTQAIDWEGRVSANYDGFTVAVGGYSGKLGNDPVGETTHHNAERFDAIAAYVSPLFRVGFEYLDASNYTSVTSATPDKADGYSAFASVNLFKHYSLFGRYDDLKPNKDTAPSKKDSYYNFGVNYAPVKNFDVSLVYKHENVDNGSFATSNGTIGSASGIERGVYDEYGIWGQVKY